MPRLAVPSCVLAVAVASGCVELPGGDRASCAPTDASAGSPLEFRSASWNGSGTGAILQLGRADCDGLQWGDLAFRVGDRTLRALAPSGCFNSAGAPLEGPVASGSKFCLKDANGLRGKQVLVVEEPSGSALLGAVLR